MPDMLLCTTQLQLLEWAVNSMQSPGNPVQSGVKERVVGRYLMFDFGDNASLI